MIENIFGGWMCTAWFFSVIIVHKDFTKAMEYAERSHFSIENTKGNSWSTISRLPLLLNKSFKTRGPWGRNTTDIDIRLSTRNSPIKITFQGSWQTMEQKFKVSCRKTVKLRTKSTKPLKFQHSTTVEKDWILDWHGADPKLQKKARIFCCRFKFHEWSDRT